MESPSAFRACSKSLIKSLIHALDGTRERFHLGRSGSNLLLYLPHDGFQHALDFGGVDVAGVTDLGVGDGVRRR